MAKYYFADFEGSWIKPPGKLRLQKCMIFNNSRHRYMAEILYCRFDVNNQSNNRILWWEKLYLIVFSFNIRNDSFIHYRYQVEIICQIRSSNERNRIYLLHSGTYAIKGGYSAR